MSRATVARADATPRSAEEIVAEATDALAASPDYDAALSTLATIAVRALADLCIIDTVEEGEIRRTQVVHADPARQELARGLMAFPLGKRQRHLALTALHSRRSVRRVRLTRRSVDAVAQGDAHRALIEALRPMSVMAVPILAKEEALGVVLFASSGRAYTAADLALAERLVRVASAFIDNARLYRKATHAVEARDRMLGFVAHDLRNPLGTISMTAEVLLEEAGSNERQRHLAQLILRSATRMNRLIQDLRDVSRIEAGQLNLQCEALDPLRLAAEAVELNQALAAGRSLTCRQRGTGRLTPVSADRDRILQVLSNLIGNAIRFTPPEGTIEVIVQPIREGVRFSVADTGSGIPADSLERIFVPFWQGQSVSREGMGLGLTIARGIVEAHGGTISAESEVGRGSTFHFSIPTATRHSADRRTGPDDRRARRRHPIPSATAVPTAEEPVP